MLATAQLAKIFSNQEVLEEQVRWVQASIRIAIGTGNERTDQHNDK